MRGEDPARIGTAQVIKTVLIAVIGPPGAGKSTALAALAADGGIPVFRLRETIRARPDLLAGLEPSRDALGWVCLEAVRRVLHASFVESHVAFGSSAALLDNFPGTADQLDSLAEVAAVRAARVVLLELQVDARTVMARVAKRRTCLNCRPDPHAPAVPDLDDADRCGSCRMGLTRRETDLPHLQALRLARYAANQPGIVRRAADRGIAYLSVNAGAATSEVRRAARRAICQLTEPTDRLGSRS